MEKKFWQTWWFWTIIVILTIGIILAIVLPIVYLTGDGPGNDDGKLNRNEATFQWNIDLDENSRFFESNPDWHVKDAQIHGQINLSLFDENDDLISVEIDKDNIFGSLINLVNASQKTETVVWYINLWDSNFTGIKFDSRNPQNGFVYNDFKFDSYKKEKINQSNTHYECENLFFENFEVNSIFIEPDYIYVGSSKIETRKLSEIWNSSDYYFRGSVKNISETNYIDSSHSYSQEGHFESNEPNSENLNEYVDFDYFKTYYMNH